MGKIGQNPKIGQLWYRSSATVRRTQKLTGSRKLPGHWTTTRSKWYLSAVHSLTCSLLWVKWMFDPIQVLGANDPWLETFNKFLSKIFVLARFTCRGQIWRKSAVAKLPKSRLVLVTKKAPALSTLFSPPLCPHLADRALNFVNVVGLSFSTTCTPVHVYRLWSKLAAVCRTYSGKSRKK